MTELTADSRPAIAPWWRWTATVDRLAVTFGDAVVEFAAEAGPDALARIVASCDGHHRVSEIARLAECAPGLVERFVAHLADAGFLREPRAVPVVAAAATAADHHHALWRDFATAEEFERSLAAASIAVLGADPVADRVRGLVRELGIASAGPERAALVIAPSGPAGAAAELNRQLIARRQSALFYAPLNGRFAEVGPLHVPDTSACWRCYQHRRAAAVTYDAPVFDAVADLDPIRARALPFVEAAVAARIADRAFRWLALADPDEPGTLHRLVVQPRREERHFVLRHPRCEDCLPQVGVRVGTERDRRR